MIGHVQKVLSALLLVLVIFAAYTAAPCTALLPIAQTQQNPGNPNVRVWVNTNSGVYHCPGTRWYGNTKQGEYMTQRQAQSRGYRPAYGKLCQ